MVLNSPVQRYSRSDHPIPNAPMNCINVPMRTRVFGVMRTPCMGVHLSRFELLNSPFERFNARFHVLVDLCGITVIEFIPAALFHKSTS
jgi:hypothetical protein